MRSDTKKRCTKTLYGFTSMHLAMKFYALCDYLETSKNGVIDAFPAFYELNTGNWHRVVKVLFVTDYDGLKNAMSEIELEVNARRDLWLNTPEGIERMKWFGIPD